MTFPSADEALRWMREQAGESGSLRAARLVYRDLAKRPHPDTGGDPDEWERLIRGEVAANDGRDSVMADTIWIISTRDPDGEPVCELSWAPERWYAPVADVRQTAMDLVSCAAYAEWIHLLITKVGLPLETVEAVTLDLMRVSGRTRDHGTDTTLDLFPASGTVRATGQREARVILKRGDLDGMVTVPEAREMARNWMAAAEATESDQLVAEAFRATLPGKDGALDRLFGYLRKLRDA